METGDAVPTGGGYYHRFPRGILGATLPQTENGSIYQLFSAVEELAVALRAQSDKEQQMKHFEEHDLGYFPSVKTPLAALHMYTEIIMQEPNHAETVERFSGKIMQSLERIEALVQALLKVSRIDAGSIAFTRMADCAGLVESAAADLSVRAHREEKRIVMEGDASQMIFCDKEWTREAVANLIKNALDHTDAGGTVTVSWECSPAMFRLSIADDGCGISEEDMSHVFKRFYRSKRSLDTQGIGLGLPLAKSIIEGQGGMIAVQSEPGTGTTFTLSFLTEL